MKRRTRKTVSLIALTLACALVVVSGAAADLRKVPVAEKTKLNGRISKRGADTLRVRDAGGVDTVVLLTDTTSVKSNKKGLGLFRRGKNFEATSLLRGLPVEVEGTGNVEGQLVAEKVRFNESDLKTVMTVASRVDPVEQEAARMSSQLNETTETAEMAQKKAEKAQAGVAAANVRIDSTNARITGLDDFVVQEAVTVYFDVNKYALSAADKQALDGLGAKAATMRGYVVEVAGFTDSTGNAEKNLELSQRRADAVVQYLGVTQNIPPRRIVTPMGYGETRTRGEATAEERRQNRRVEVKLLVNRGQAM